MSKDPWDYVCEQCGNDDIKVEMPIWINPNDTPAVLSIEDVDMDAEPLYGECWCSCQDDPTRVVTRSDRDEERNGV